MFGHEKFRPYQASLEFLTLTQAIVERQPDGKAYLLDHLRRASLSILLNIAEGTGRRTEIDRLRFYGMARGSAMECAAVLDAMTVLRMIDEKIRDEGKGVLREIVAILVVVERNRGKS